jgi:glutathione S-transferase
MQLYIANKNYSSWSLRPWVLMRTLGIAFVETLKPFPMGGGATGFDSFSPSARVPVLVDEGITVWDTLAITEYVAEQHAQVWPSDNTARAWARSAAAEMHSGFSAMRNHCPMSCGVRVELNAPLPEGLQNDVQRLQDVWQDGLQRFGGPFLAGHAFSAVDAFFCPVAFRVQTYGLTMSTDCMAYVNTLLDLPAMQDWYNRALQEPWIEPAHDAEVLSNGRLIHDYRVHV